jgi:hypothetical protein
MNIYQALAQGEDAMWRQPAQAYMAHSYLLSMAAGLSSGTNTGRLRVLVEQGATSPAEMDHAMAVAAENNFYRAMVYLHVNGASNTTRALFAAARRGHVDIVQYFHCLGHPNLPGVWFWAKKGRHGKLMQYLADNGIPDDSGFRQD